MLAFMRERKEPSLRDESISAAHKEEKNQVTAYELKMLAGLGRGGAVVFAGTTDEVEEEASGAGEAEFEGAMVKSKGEGEVEELLLSGGISRGVPVVTGRACEA